MATRPAHQKPETGDSSPPQKPTVRELAAKVLRRESQYPHDLHPGLVPGIGVDEQRVRYGTDRLVFGVAAVLILGFVGWGVLSTESLKAVSDVALAWVVKNTGWFFSSLIAVVLIFMLFVGFSRFGKIPLGVDGEKPEYSKFSWIAMMFSAGVGIGLFFFGPYEPLAFYLSPAPGTADPETAEAMHKAMAQSYFHWGLNAWVVRLRLPRRYFKIVIGKPWRFLILTTERLRDLFPLPLPGSQDPIPGCSARTRPSSTSASSQACRRMAARSPENKYSSTRVPCGDATAINTQPTALPSCGSGPAAPVVDTPRSVSSNRRTPSAICPATPASTDPAEASRSASTPRTFFFTKLE